jgi:hypothetical protein
MKIEIEYKQGDSDLITDFKFYIQLKKLSDEELLNSWYEIGNENDPLFYRRSAFEKEMKRRLKK